jgi:hypothetical protein
MTDAISDLEALWERAPRAGRPFDPQKIAHLPEVVRGYLTHTIAPGTPLASAVRLRMHGRIRLKRWRKFKAVQVITCEGGMVWRAAVRMAGTWIRGYDSLLGGEGSMQWRLLGMIPVIRESGPDISRSIAERVAAESIWLPSMLVGDRARWRALDAGGAQASVSIAGRTVDLRLALDHGCLTSVGLSRWGNPDGGAFCETPFGAHVDQEATFGGYTIPVRLRVGWHFDDVARFDAEGKFFEVSIDAASYR